MDSISKNKKKRTIIILILSIISLIVLSSIVYGAFSSTLNISGVGYARIEKDVRITDFKLSSSSINSTSFYEEFSINTISSKFNLLSDTSSIVFDIEVTNYGASDVGILQVIGTIPDGLSYEIINYNLMDKICDDSGKCNCMAVKTFQIRFTGSKGEYEITQELDFRSYHQVSYTGIVNYNYPTEVIDGGTLNVTFKEELKRILILSNGTELNYYTKITNGQIITIENVSNNIEFTRKEYVAKLVNGSVDTVGSEVCIEEECFYIISNDGSTIAMLAKYNLLVGNKYDYTNGILPLENPTGRQDVTAKAWFDGFTEDNQIIGTLAFSNTNYWSNTVSNYPSYVYNEKSYLYEYVENYKDYLEGLGISINEARLITIKELENLGCSCLTYSCSEAPEWTYSTTYWTGEAFSSESMWRVSSDNHFYDNGGYDVADTRGVRPVVELSVEEVEPLVNVVSGNYNTVGSEIEIGEERFYVISSDEESVTMLAKYNLYVGNECTTNSSSSCTAYGDEATGKQDSTMIGYPMSLPYKGTTAFSSVSQKGTNYSDYSGSIVEGYVNNYKSYLESLDITIKEARLITKDELEKLGCNSSNFLCDEAPDFVYSTSYWTGTPYDTTSIWRVIGNATFARLNYHFDYCYGVRPVIKIPLTEF